MEVKTATELFLIGVIGTPTVGQLRSVFCGGVAEASAGSMG